MSMVKPRTGSPPPRKRVRQRLLIDRNTQIKILLTLMLVICLWRATSMWFGYPARFEDSSGEKTLPMRILLYSIIPMLGIYFLLDFRQVSKYINRINWLVVIFSSICICSLFVSIDFTASLKGLTAVSILTFSALAYRFKYGSEATLDVITKFAIVSAFANILYTLSFPHFATMGGSYSGMVKGLFYHKNGLGQFSAISFLLIFISINPSKGITWDNLIRGLAAIVALILVVAARSSTAVVMIFVGMAVIVGVHLLQMVKSSAIRSSLLLTLAVGGGVVGTIGYLFLIEMVAEAFGKDMSFSGRTEIWDQLIPLVYDKPLLGHGFATFRQSSVIAEYVHLGHDVKSVHSTYLELALNLGVPALVCWSVFLLSTLYKKIVTVYQSNQMVKNQLAEVVVIVLVVIGSFTEAGLMVAPVILWPLLVVALPLTRSDRALKMRNSYKFGSTKARRDIEARN